MGKISKFSTATMSYKAWQDYRHKLELDFGIGGSTSEIIGGCNKYCSDYTLAMQMLGKIAKEDISDKESVRLGHDLEDYVAKRFTEATGKKVHKENAILTNSDYPFAFANIDRKVSGENAGLECKTTISSDVLDQVTRAGDDDFPLCYLHQCLHYMAVGEYDAYYLAVLVWGKGFYTFKMERKNVQGMIDGLMQLEKEFVENLKAGIIPEPDGSESTKKTLLEMYPQDNGESTDISSCADILNSMWELKQERKAYESRISDIDDQVSTYENIIRDVMGDAASASCGKFKVSYKTSNRSSFDTKRFDAENPGVRDRYMNKTQTRTLRVTAGKEK